MSLESIFDEDDIEQRHYVSGDASVKDTKRGAPSKDSLPDLQRMFPTPPSVEPVSCLQCMFRNVCCFNAFYKFSVF